MEFYQKIFLIAVIALTVFNLIKRSKTDAAKNRKPGPASAGIRKEPEAAAPAAPAVPAEPGEGTSLLRSTPARQEYVGSLKATSLEGVDPCHEEQMQGMDAYREEGGEPAPAGSGLNLSWTGSDVVRGVIYSEVLARKQRRI